VPDLACYNFDTRQPISIIFGTWYMTSFLYTDLLTANTVFLFPAVQVPAQHGACRHLPTGV